MIIKITENGITTEEIIPIGTKTKIKDIWDNIEVLDNIHIPSINKTYPVFEKTENALKLHDSTMVLNDFWIMTINFPYDIELIKG